MVQVPNDGPWPGASPPERFPYAQVVPAGSPGKGRRFLKLVLRQWWAVPLLTLGLLNPVMIGYAAYRLRSKWNLVAAVGYLAIEVLWFTTDGPFVGVAVVAWPICTLHALLLQRRYSGTPAGSLDPDVMAAQARLKQRERSRKLVETNPALAAELGVGRPDLGRHHDDGGLVDINAVPASVLVEQLGLPAAAAAAIVAERTRNGPFFAVEEPVMRCGLDPGVLSAVRDRLIVFPARWYSS